MRILIVIPGKFYCTPTSVTDVMGYLVTPNMVLECLDLPKNKLELYMFAENANVYHFTALDCACLVEHQDILLPTGYRKGPSIGPMERNVPKCECGQSGILYAKHSDYCPLYAKEAQ